MDSVPPEANETIFMTQNNTDNRSKSTVMFVFPKDNKPFQCGLCSVAFSVNTALVVHVETHFVHKPYQCGFCSVSYDSNPDLLSHVDTHKPLLHVPESNVPLPSHTDTVMFCQQKSVTPGVEQSSLVTDYVSEGDEKDNTKGNMLTVCTESLSSVTGQTTDSVHHAGTGEQRPEEDCVVDSACEESADDNEANCIEAGSSYRVTDGSSHSPASDVSVSVKREIYENHSPDMATCGRLGYKCQTETETENQDHSCETVGLQQSVCLRNPPTIKQECAENRTTASYVCKCGDCNAVFQSTLALTQHWKSCHSACSVCSESFADPLSLQHHMKKSAHRDVKSKPPCRPFLCGLCGADFLLTRYIEAHIKTFHEIQVDIEPIVNNSVLKKNCRKRGISRKTLDSAANGKINKGSVSSRSKGGASVERYDCPVCPVQCDSRPQFKVHVHSAHKADGRFQCPVCQKTSGRLYDLKLHYKAQHADPDHIRPHECQECDKKFKRPHHLRDHVEAFHSLKRPYACPGCDRSHKTRSALRSHVRFCKALVKSGTESLTIPQEGMKVKHTLSKSSKCMKPKERQVHTGNICHICGKSVKGLKKHLAMMHSDARPHQCSFCDKAYKTKALLKVHVRTHTKEKPFMCEICGKSFAIKNTLKYHKNSHTNARPYPCVICGRGFNYHSALMIHRRRHTGDKRYTCDICGMKFFTSVNLRRHAVKHTDLRPWVCNKCGKTYRSNSSLWYHKAHSHKKNE